jgi:hypothetical protein
MNEKVEYLGTSEYFIEDTNEIKNLNFVKLIKNDDISIHLFLELKSKVVSTFNKLKNTVNFKNEIIELDEYQFINLSLILNENQKHVLNISYFINVFLWNGFFIKFIKNSFFMIGIIKKPGIY